MLPHPLPIAIPATNGLCDTGVAVAAIERTEDTRSAVCKTAFLLCRHRLVTDRFVQSARQFLQFLCVAGAAPSRTLKQACGGWAPRRRAKEMGPEILLLHAANDFVITYEQSRDMHRALQRAGKASAYVGYARGEHTLYVEDIRIDLLTRMSSFIDRHLGTD